MAGKYQKSEKEIAYDFLRIVKKPENMKQGEALSLHTTFRIGGPADFFLLPESEEQLLALIQYCLQYEIPYFLIGRGSNLLVSDAGYRGAVITLEICCGQLAVEEIKNDSVNNTNTDKEQIEKWKITAGAGIPLAKLAAYAAEYSLEGLEFASGIPGTIGGAVMMNAGAYGGEISQVLASARVFSYGTIRNYSNQSLHFGYRHSLLMEEKGIVLAADFILKQGDKEKILEKMADFNRRRREKQPLEYPSAGSTFKRPKGYFAGKLIEDSGLKGYCVGEIGISEKHSGFVVNKGNGTAEQAWKLIQDVQRIVWEKQKVKLEPEVRLLGFEETKIYH